MLIYSIKLKVNFKNYIIFFIYLIILDEQIPIDFNPNEECLFCHNRQEYLENKKTIHRINEHHHHHSIIEPILNDDDENAPLDLSLKSTSINKSPLITSNNRANIKHRPFYDIKSDISPIYGQEEFDRFMSEMIASQLGRKKKRFFIVFLRYIFLFF
jgi:hypothetical protein